MATAPLTAERQPRWGFAVSSGILGWVLDAYDFFILVFLLDPLAAHFHVGKGAVVGSITATLVMRPIGALLFGFCADRWGRRIPLLACVLYFSIITALTPLAPTFSVFLLLRALYGIGMGGYWGVGAALVMESCPGRLRGLFSGMLQAGYSVGYLLAAAMSRSLAPALGWQSLFYFGLLIAAVVILLTCLAPDSYVRQNLKTALPSTVMTIRTYLPVFLLLVGLMTLITFLSHGTQDLYPDFLHVAHGFNMREVANIAMLYNLAAMIGAVVFGRASDWLGRRNAIYVALVFCVFAIPAWAFGQSWITLTLGAMLMQFGVQGAFGVIPAHLNELAPPAARGLFPGLVYQLGVLCGAPSVIIEYALRDHLGYAMALTVFECTTFTLLALLLLYKRENRGNEFLTS